MKFLRLLSLFVFSFVFFSLTVGSVLAQAPYTTPGGGSCVNNPTPGPGQPANDCEDPPEDFCPRGPNGENCIGTSRVCQSGTCLYPCLTTGVCAQSAQCTNWVINGSEQHHEDGRCFQNWKCTAGTGDWTSITIQIRQCGDSPNGPTGGGGGGGTPTPGGGTPTPTPAYRFQGNIYQDASAVPIGIGGSSNVCAGDTSVGVAGAGSVSIQRTGESKTQTLGGGTVSYSIQTNTANGDYQVALNLPFPPPDPENAWVCACNADPSDQYRCLYTSQQPSQGNSGTNFFVKLANTSNTAWFQTLGGSSFAFGSIESNIPFDTCTAPLCTPALIATDPAGTVDSPGFALTDSGEIVTSASGGVYVHGENSRSSASQAMGLGVRVPMENYAYFYAKMGDKAQNLANAGKPVQEPGLGVYRYNGNLVIDEENIWNVANNEQIIVFVDGNLTLDDEPGGEHRLTTVAPGGNGFLMFIVRGNITVTENVGYNDIATNPASADVASVEGVFVADGTLTIASAGTAISGGGGGGSSSLDVEYLVVGGGGGGGGVGGNGYGGGGGGGGQVITSSASLEPGSVSVTIGSGGTAGASGGTNNGGNGSSSSLGSLATATGGGGGAGGATSPYPARAGSNGASGGGGSRTAGAGGTGSPGGNGGAGQDASPYVGGGGGGAGGNGATGTAGGAGGSGNSVWSSTYGAGGSGKAYTSAGAGAAGAANTGNGGGGAATGNTASYAGGAGGSGVVRIRYAGSPVATGGTITESGGYTYHTFTSDGTFTVSGSSDGGVSDRKFIGAGTFVGWGGVALNRDYGGGSNPELNNTSPTEVFIFRPDFIVNAPREVKSAQMTWREVEPSF